MKEKEEDDEQEEKRNGSNISVKQLNELRVDKEFDEKIISRYVQSLSELQRIGFIRLTSTGHQIRKLMVTWVN